MATLYLLRHAKSAWDVPDLPDHDRPLARRGSRATRLVARHLRDKRLAPDLVLCSSARRAVETLEGVRSALPKQVSTSIERRLYAADGDELLDRLHEVPDAVASVLLIGHNPGLQEVALDLAGDGDPAALHQLRSKLPTAALVTLAVPTLWRDLGFGCARLVSLVTPKDLG